MYAQQYGTAYGYSYTCDLTEGALPIFWEEVWSGWESSATVIDLNGLSYVG